MALCPVYPDKLPKFWRQDRRVVLEAVKQDWMAVLFVFDFLSPDRVADQEIVLTAVRQDGMVLAFVPAGFLSWENKNIVIDAVKQNGMALQYALSWRQDNQVVVEAVKQNGMALQYASDDLRKDFGVVGEAVQQNAEALEFVSDAETYNTFLEKLKNHHREEHHRVPCQRPQSQQQSPDYTGSGGHGFF